MTQLPQSPEGQDPQGSQESQGSQENKESAPGNGTGFWISLFKNLYDSLEGPAHNIKAIMQMFIGIVLVYFLFVRGGFEIFPDSFDWARHYKFMEMPPLEIVAKCLMYAAGVELAYMLFTPGPDEAIGPVMLGIASTILIVVSDGKDDWKDATIVPLLSISLGLLFYINERYERVKDAKKQKELEKNLGSDRIMKYF